MELRKARELGKTSPREMTRAKAGREKLDSFNNLSL